MVELVGCTLTKYAMCLPLIELLVHRVWRFVWLAALKIVIRYLEVCWYFITGFHHTAFA